MVVYNLKCLLILCSFTMSHELLPTSRLITIPVLNIGRVGRDIVQYLLFCLLPIRYGEIVHHIVCVKNS